MDTIDAYTELGLNPGATRAQVKAAWRRLVSQWHPDRNPSATAVGRMQRINQAFEELRGGEVADETAVRPDASPPQATPPPPPPPPPHTPARAITRKLRLNLEDAATGCVRMMRGKLTDTCSACDGAGFRLPGGACSGCAGSGEVRQRSWYGWFGTASTCEACGGNGVARVVCADCDGDGKLAPRPYRVAVRIPPGVRDGDVLHVDAGQARAGHAAVKLDLHVELAPHPLFTLADDGTVRCEMPVDGFAWIAQRQVEVPTLNGLHPVRLNRDQRSCRLPGLGFPVSRRGPRGDMIVHFAPTFPERFSTDQQILIDQLIATGADGSAADAPTKDWNRALRAWERDCAKRSEG